jgi:DNA-directed RNA polymerase specialized sigma subunit
LSRQLPCHPVPFQPREQKPGHDEAMERLRAIHAEIKALEEHRRELVEQRKETIRQVLDLGGTLKRIAEALGVTAVRARQMRDGL